MAFGIDKIVQLSQEILLQLKSGSGGGASTISDGADVTQGSKDDAQATDATSSWTVIALLKGLYTRLGNISSNLATAAKGATVAGSPTSRSKSADVTALDVQIVDASGNPIVTFGNTVAFNAGASSSTTQRIVTASDSPEIPLIGSLTETTPASDTASSGLNGRLQRIAQRLTSLIGLFPTSLGQGTMATSMKVVLPSDQTAIPSSGNDIDNAAQSANIKPLPVGGKAVDPTTYAPAYTVNDAAQAAFDKDTGALIVLQGKLNSVDDSVTTIPGEPTKTTYSSGITGLASATSATDIFELAGSATKTVRVKRIEISGIASAAATIDIQILKRSTANSSGTSSSPTGVPHDSGNAAATAVVKAYTANPTTGSLVGVIRSLKAIVSTAATPAVSCSNLVFTFGENGNQNIVLRGTTQSLVVNLNGATISGGSFNINITWTEE